MDLENLNLRHRNMWALIEGEWVLVEVITRIRLPKEGQPGIWRVLYGKTRLSVSTDKLRVLLPEPATIAERATGVES